MKMCAICRNEYNEYIAISLTINRCYTVQKIPFLPNLRGLNCYDCPKIQEIPILPQLENFECHNCPNIREIPSLPNLKRLFCENCPKLQKISPLPNIKDLSCIQCPNLVFQPNNNVSWINNCPWIRKKNIKLIQNIQKKLRRWLNFRIYTRNPKYSAWLYAPDGPLGHKSRKRLEGIIFQKSERD